MKLKFRYENREGECLKLFKKTEVPKRKKEDFHGKDSQGQRQA